MKNEIKEEIKEENNEEDLDVATPLLTCWCEGFLDANYNPKEKSVEVLQEVSKVLEGFKTNKYGYDFSTFLKAIYDWNPDRENKGKLDCDFSNYKSYEGSFIVKFLKSQYGWSEDVLQVLWHSKAFEFHRLNHQLKIYYYEKELNRRAQAQLKHE